MVSWLPSLPDIGSPFCNCYDLRDEETRGSEFDSTQPRGPSRAVENTEESAWWSKHQSLRMVRYLALTLTLIIFAAVAALILSIGALNAAPAQHSGAIVQNVG